MTGTRADIIREAQAHIAKALELLAPYSLDEIPDFADVGLTLYALANAAASAGGVAFTLDRALEYALLEEQQVMTAAELAILEGLK